MKPNASTARFALVLLVAVVLFPLGRLAVRAVQEARVLDTTAPGGYDWVRWNDADGPITARYVFPSSPAADAGVEAGDVLAELEFQPFFNAEDALSVIEATPPGEARAYTLLRPDGSAALANVTVTHYPTFLYPLSGSLWQFALWGFMIGSFLHVLALVIVGPLSVRSPQARRALWLILASAAWLAGSFVRVGLLTVFGPATDPASAYAVLLRVLTIFSLGGWIAFPAVLLHKALGDVPQLHPHRLRTLVYLPAVLLGLAALLTLVFGNVGPVTVDRLVAPILFYECSFVAAATGLRLTLPAFPGPDEAALAPTTWSRAGSAFVLIVALLAGLSVLGIVPLFAAVDEVAAGWVIVSVQLLSVAPVALLTLATLRYGKVDQVLGRALTYVTVLGLIFFLFVGGSFLIERYVAGPDMPYQVLAGLYVVALLVVFERIARALRLRAASWFATERQRARQRLTRFGEQMRSLVDYDTLAHRTVRTAAEAFDVRSAVLYLRPHADAAWIHAAHHPEPPYLTREVVARLWPHFEAENKIWSRNTELNETDLPDELGRLLRRYRAALVITVKGEQRPIGLLVLTGRSQKRQVYNLEDVEMLRSLCTQLAFAVERLRLVEREKQLVEANTEAQLAALRAQINPHFLFNTLNTIAAFIEEQPEMAERTVQHLSAIFRHTLNVGSASFVSLREELALVRHYLAIEQARHGDRLRVEEDVPDDLLGTPVPAFAVQTLVENAVQHGLARKREGGTLRLTARSTEDAVEIAVHDTGAGIPALFTDGGGTDDLAPFFGIGLHNVASRLTKLYGRPGLLHLQSRPDHGTTARIALLHDPPPGDGLPTTDISLWQAG